MNARLVGCTVVVTREHRGELGRLLEQEGAHVVHVPLIEVVDARAAELDDAWDAEPDWLIVTSPAGASRTGDAAALRPSVRLAAVGTATARELERRVGRPVDLVPTRQLAESLVAAFVERNPEPCRVIVAQADLAAPTLVDGLVRAGHDVHAVVAYHTRLRRPDAAERAALHAADAVVFASGSAARAWAEALGSEAATELPRLVVAIGPTTAAVASEIGLKVSHVAADHSIAGVIDELSAAWANPVAE